MFVNNVGENGVILKMFDDSRFIYKKNHKISFMILKFPCKSHLCQFLLKFLEHVTFICIYISYLNKAIQMQLKWKKY